MNRVLPGALVAIGAGAGFGNPLFSLPALTSLRYPALELEWLLLPTVAAVMLAIAVAGGAAIPGRGYPVTAAGGLAGTIAIMLAERQVGGADATVAWVLVMAAAGGMALGGLAIAATGAAGAERLAIAAGLAAGVVAGNPVPGLPYLVHLGVFVVAAVAAALAWRDAPPPTVSGTIGVVVAVGVIVMAGLVARSAGIDELGPGTWAKFAALGVAVLAGLVLSWHAGAVGGVDLARWPVLGFALAGPVTVLVSGSEQQAGPLGLAIAGCAAVAGGGLAAYADRLAPWDAAGGFVAAAGLALGPLSDRHSTLAHLLVLGGAAFALGAGLARTAALPAGGAGIGLGLASMLLAAQALGPLTLEVFSFTGPTRDTQLAAPAATAVAALVIVVLFARHRPTDRLSRELVTQAA